MKAKLGQHFLKDAAACETIAQAVPGRRILEIGPGLGALTGALLAAGAEVVAVEKDEVLAAGLAAGVPPGGRLRVVSGDFLEFDLDSLGEGPWQIAGNLPYAVASPILQKILPWPRWERAALMFQKEVAERITAAPGGPDYGLLTLSAWLHAEAGVILELDRKAFSPPPKVASAVVYLRRRPKPLLAPERQEPFFRLARAAFQQRRKMAAGAISKTLGLERAKVEAAFERLGVDAQARAERIPPDAWLKLPDQLGL